jgi:hypothetical protein
MWSWLFGVSLNGQRQSQSYKTACYGVGCLRKAAKFLESLANNFCFCPSVCHDGLGKAHILDLKFLTPRVICVCLLNFVPSSGGNLSLAVIPHPPRTQSELLSGRNVVVGAANLSFPSGSGLESRFFAS